jgi:hypothetical protein
MVSLSKALISPGLKQMKISAQEQVLGVIHPLQSNRKQLVV